MARVQSLRNVLLRPIGVAAAVLAIGFGLLVHITVEEFVSHLARARSDVSIQRAASALERTGVEGAAPMLASLAGDPELKAAFIVGANPPRVLGAVDLQFVGRPPAVLGSVASTLVLRMLHAERGDIARAESPELHYAARAIGSKEEPLVLLMGFDMSRLEGELFDSALTLIMLSIAGLAGLFVIAAWVVGKNILAPLAAITSAIQRREAGDLTSFAPVGYKGELKELAIALNRALGTATTQAHQLRSLISNIPGAVCRTVVGHAGNALFLDADVWEITGYQPHELMEGDRSLRDLIHADDRERVARVHVDAVLHHRAYRIEYRVLDRDGRERWVSEHGRPTFDSHGRLRYLDSVIFDISDRRAVEDERAQFERALRASEKEQRLAREAAEAGSRAKSAFLATMSHELRTPLNAVIGFTEVLAATELDADQRELVGTIGRSGEALLAVINDILDLSKIEAGKMIVDASNFDVGAMIRDVDALLSVTAKAKDVEVRVDPALEELVRGDAVRTRQVLFNLAGNAIKFTEPGGRVSMSAEREGEMVRVIVEDNGIGIPADRQALLFQAFQQADATTTRKHGGTGLGLAISKRLVEMMGGTIGVESEPGRGSRFWFTLAAASRRSVEVERTPSEEPTPITVSGNLRVLVAEDNPVNMLLAKRMLASLGCDVEHASDGLAAVARAAEGGFDVILMDCQMPALDGYEATREIRRREGERRTPIVAMTANAMSEDEARCREAGMDDYLTKPMRSVELKRALERVRLQRGEV